MGYDTAPTDPHHGGKLTFDMWKGAVCVGLSELYGISLDDAAAYMQAAGEETWRGYYDDGEDADSVVSGEAAAASWLSA